MLHQSGADQHESDGKENREREDGAKGHGEHEPFTPRTGLNDFAYR